MKEMKVREYRSVAGLRRGTEKKLGDKEMVLLGWRL
jgi:hypothetical protein